MESSALLCSRPAAGAAVDKQALQELDIPVRGHLDQKSPLLRSAFREPDESRARDGFSERRESRLGAGVGGLRPLVTFPDNFPIPGIRLRMNVPP